MVIRNRRGDSFLKPQVYLQPDTSNFFRSRVLTDGPQEVGQLPELDEPGVVVEQLEGLLELLNLLF